MDLHHQREYSEETARLVTVGEVTLPELDQAAVENVIATWTEQSVELSNLDFVRYVQVFENKGAMMGCSNPHPHSQIWAQSQLPNEISKAA